MKRFGMYLYALARCLYLFTIGYLISKKNRMLISQMCELFGYQKVKEFFDPALKTDLPQVAITDIIRDDGSLQLREIGWADGNISLAELATIAKIVRQYQPSAIFEIGTFDGRTTLNLAANAAEEARVYTLDLPEKGRGGMAHDASFVGKAVTGRRFHRTDCERKITQLFGDSATFDFTPYEKSMDLVFIDGAHTYQYVLSDTEKAMKLLRNGRGIILWHDYSWVWGDVARALNRMQREDKRFAGIKQIAGTSLVIYANGVQFPVGRA